MPRQYSSTHTTVTREQLEATLTRLENGESVIFSNATLNAFDSLMMRDTSERAARFYRDLKTIPNPNRVGLLDEYVGSYSTTV
jgi:hypothetical protein